MGHDIYGRASRDGDEIAYLRRGAGNPLARAIYQALQCPEHDCGCSGCGTGALFTAWRLQSALQALPTDDEHEPERTFLRDIISKRGQNGAWIDFW